MPAMNHTSAVDIVYLWVDGNDPAWRARRRAAITRLSDTHLNGMALYGNVEGRYRDNDELRYNLRALEQFFPDHGHIYVVTDAQTPAWLQPSDRLTLVDHRDLIPAADLPTFDSGHIESYIHRIKNLSERYFYLNDDVFFGAPVVLNDWFSDDGIYVAWSDEPPVTDEPLRQDATSLENACRLSNQWFATQGALQSYPEPYQHTFRTFAHAPRPMRKSILSCIEAIAPEMFAGVRSTVFRSWDKPTIVSDFVMRWALAQGKAQVRDYRHIYISTGEQDKTAVLARLQSQAGQLAFFCINDTTDDAYPHDPRLAEIRQTLQGMFPIASSFESAASNCQV
jgi:hypothetical protein